jgi:hypothetical protein
LLKRFMPNNGSQVQQAAEERDHDAAHLLCRHGEGALPAPLQELHA